jgi:hypothetical protein
MKQITSHGVEEVSRRGRKKQRGDRTSQGRRPRQTSPSRELRLQRLKQQCMPRTAALDTRKAYDLGKIIEPKVRVERKNSLGFLESKFVIPADDNGGNGGGSGENVKENATTERPGTALSQQGKESNNRPGTSEKPESSLPVGEDEQLAALILDSDREMTPSVVNMISNPRLRLLAQRFTKCDWEHVNGLSKKRGAEIVRALRRQMDKKQQHYDSVGIFHPDANKRRAEGWLQVTLRSRLKYSVIVNEVLESIMLADAGPRPTTPTDVQVEDSADKVHDMPDQAADKQIRRRIRDRTASVVMAAENLDYKALEGKSAEERGR